MFDNLTATQKRVEEANSEAEELIDRNTAGIVLKVIGVGGAGNNAIEMMDKSLFKHVEFIVANTDAQALALNSCQNKIALGKENRGLGAGSDPEVGAKATRDSSTQIQEKLKGADVVIIAAGFGGGTGTGAAPVVAEIAKNSGALTIAIVTTPFLFEGPKRRRHAREGIEKLAKNVDAYVVLSNDKLAATYGDIPIEDTFELSNLSLKNIILAIHDILYRIGKINIDYADVRKVLVDSGLTMVGIASATGKDRAQKAVEKAFEQNLYENVITRASKMLVNIQYDKKTSLNEINTAIAKVYEVFESSFDNDDESFEAIIGQELVETKDNSELFKVSIIVTGTTDANAKKLVQPKTDEIENAVSYSQAPIHELKTYSEYKPEYQPTREEYSKYEAPTKEVTQEQEISMQAEPEKYVEKVHVVEYQPLEEDTYQQTNEFSSNYFEEPTDEIPDKYSKYENLFATSKEDTSSSYYVEDNKTQEYLKNTLGSETQEVNSFLSNDEPEMSEDPKKSHREGYLRNSKENNGGWF